MIKNDNKDKIQQKAHKAWYSAGSWGTLIMPTGSGKTRVGVMAITRHLDSVGGKVLIIVPTSNLRDNEWVNEFTKWGYKEYLQHVTIECIQTAYKNTYKYADYSLMVIDEVHTTLSPKYSKIYSLRIPYMLGLTATPPDREEYKKYLQDILPTVYELTVHEAIDKQLVAPYLLYNLPVRFTRAERAMYNKFNQMFNSAQLQLNTYIKAFPSLYKGKTAFDLAQEATNDPNHQYKKAGQKFWQGMSLRKWVCYKASRKLEACLGIIQKYPDKKWIVFSKTTAFADELHKLLQEKNIPSVAYHSKMKTAERAEILEQAKDPSIKVICTAEALNAGYDLPAIDGGICASGTATFLTFIQQLGRSIRFIPNKRALFVNLYVEYTQEETWIKKKTFGMKPKWIINKNEIEWES